MEHPESSQRQTCKLSLNLRDATWDRLHLASRTPQVALRPMCRHYVWPTAFSRATSSILTYKVHRAKRWNNGNSGADHNAKLHKGTVHRGYADALISTPRRKRP